MAKSSKSPLGIIAGGGELPFHLVQACRAQGRSCTIIALAGEADSLPEEPSLWIRIGEAAKAFQKFRDDGVAEIVMAGKVQRPGLLELRPDWRTLKFLARAGTTAFTDQEAVGDDRLLRAVIAEMENEGFQVIGIEDVLADLHVPPGALGDHVPVPLDQPDIDVGLEAARALGRADVGQAVVVANGAVIGRERIQGTDALITGVSVSGARKPILVKTSKPSQDRRADLPVVGPNTVQLCADYGFRGVVVEAGGTLVLDQKTVIDIANREGLFVYAVCLPEDTAANG